MSDLMKRFEDEFGLVLTEDGRVVTNSIKVGLVYDKNHKDVLKKIRDFIALIPELAGRNFSLSEYKDVTGRVLPMYLMDRQGFSMLVNKFTTDRATLFTYKYTQAFEQMAEEIIELKEEVKTISTIALSDKEQSQRLLEMNLHDFSERKTQKKFANCNTYEEYKILHDRFVEHAKTLDADVRVIRYHCAIKGMEKLRVKLLISSPMNAGYTMMIDGDIKTVLRQIDKTNNRMLGGEKGYKTKTINNLNDQLENSTPYPKLEEFTWLDAHGISNNYLFEVRDDVVRKTDTYVKWLSKFPFKQMTAKDNINIDWNKPIKIFLKYIAVPTIDHMNMDKASIDTILTKCYGVDDNIVHNLQSDRVGTCDNYYEGKIGYVIKNIQ